MTDETPQNPWENTRGQGRKKSELDSLLDIARQYQKSASGDGPRPDAPRPQISVRLIVGIVIVLWLATGFYQVQPDQQGVVMRFGKKVSLTQPGLNYHLPYPFESVIIANTTRENRINIGFDPQDNNNNKDVLSESLMLTGDDNIVDVSVVVTWQVQDITKYLFKSRDPQELAKLAAESVLREIIAQHNIQDILTTGRRQIEIEAQTRLQKLMDEYETGILITRVGFRDVAPPSQVVDAFREVQRAQADAEQSKNKAQAYANDILPRAKGDAEQMVQQAEGYKESVVAKASGEAQRFDAIYSAYQGAKEVTQKRMYLEAMEEIYARAKHIIIDKNAGANTIVPLTLPSVPAAVAPLPAAAPTNAEGN